jgi:hypothetical protein
VTTILLVVSSASGYIRTSSPNKTAEAAVSTTTATPIGPNSSSITENPWEETLVYGDNEVSKNRRANDRFLENNKIRQATKKKQTNNSTSPNSITSEGTGNRNKRQHDFVVTKLNDSDHVLHNVQKTILNVEKVITNFERAINKINKDDGKMEHRGNEGTEDHVAKNTNNVFKSSPTDDSHLTKTRIARQGVSPNNVYLNTQNYQQQPRIVNRPAYSPSYVNPQPTQSYNNFRPMTNVGTQLANYVSPNSQFVTGNPSYSTPTTNYYTPNNQPYAGNPYSPSDFTFPQQQQQYQQPQQYVQPQPQYQQQQYIPQQTYTQQQPSYPQPVASYPQQQQQQQPYYPPQQPIYQPQPIPVYSQPQPQPQPQQFYQPQSSYPTYQQPQEFSQQRPYIPNNYSPQIPTTAIHNRLPITVNNHISPSPQRLPITIHVPYDNSAFDSKYSPRITRRPQRDAPKVAVNVNGARSSPPFTIRTVTRESSTPILSAIANRIRGSPNSRSDAAHPEVSVNFYNRT